MKFCPHESGYKKLQILSRDDELGRSQETTRCTPASSVVFLYAFTASLPRRSAGSRLSCVQKQRGTMDSSPACSQLQKPPETRTNDRFLVLAHLGFELPPCKKHRRPAIKSLIAAVTMSQKIVAPQPQALCSYTHSRPLSLGGPQGLGCVHALTK